MAYTNSGKLSVGQTYNLGDYALSLIVTTVAEEDIKVIQGDCRNGTEHARTGIDEPIDINVRSWRVEANETSADVYATIYRGPINTGNTPQPIANAETGTFTWISTPYTCRFKTASGKLTLYYSDCSITGLFASETAGAQFEAVDADGNRFWDSAVSSNRPYTYLDKSVYYSTISTSTAETAKVVSGVAPCAGKDIFPYSPGAVAWYMIHGDPSFEEEVLVARFSIDIAEAGGGSWEDPGSTGDPSYTLNITVNGALSGRHNDPLNDTSYHYLPTDQDTATVYGSGGDGGHGGGGGAGASTVVIHTIATERAGSVDETAIAKRHGYGSGGGKGGKGADGCILVYY